MIASETSATIGLRSRRIGNGFLSRSGTKMVCDALLGHEACPRGNHAHQVRGRLVFQVAYKGASATLRGRDAAARRRRASGSSGGSGKRRRPARVVAITQRVRPTILTSYPSDACRTYTASSASFTGSSRSTYATSGSFPVRNASPWVEL